VDPAGTVMERPSIVSVGMSSARRGIAVDDVSIYGVPEAGDGTASGTSPRHQLGDCAWSMRRRKLRWMLHNYCIGFFTGLYSRSVPFCA